MNGSRRASPFNLICNLFIDPLIRKSFQRNWADLKDPLTTRPVLNPTNPRGSLTLKMWKNMLKCQKWKMGNKIWLIWLLSGLFLLASCKPKETSYCRKNAVNNAFYFCVISWSKIQFKATFEMLFFSIIWPQLVTKLWILEQKLQ